MLSAGLPLASRAHGANTQSAPPPHLSVSVSESHTVILLLFLPPQFLTLSLFIHLPRPAISPYIRAITSCSTVSFSQLSHSLGRYSALFSTPLFLFCYVLLFSQGSLSLRPCPSNYSYSTLCVCAMIWL